MDGVLAARADYRWHGCDISSALPLGFASVGSATEALASLRVDHDAGLGMPTSALLRESRFTGYRLHADGADACWLVRDSDRMHLTREQIRLTPAPAISDELEYLRTRALALWLHLVGLHPIHASAVAKNGRAVALVGDSGAGKSTLAAAMACLDYQILADDLLPLGIRQGAVPVYPGARTLRLWPDSAGHFHAHPASLPRVTEASEKRELVVAAAPSAVPHLRAVFLLNRALPTAEIAIEALPASKALLALIANGQMAGPAELLGLGGARLRAYTEVLRHVRVFSLHYPADYARLPEVCARLDAHLQSS